MLTTRCAASLGAILLAIPGLVAARADERAHVVRIDSRGTRPAVLVLPAWGTGGRSRAADRIEVVDPDGVHRPPVGTYPWYVADERDPNEAPLAGQDQDYELVQTLTPNPLIPQLSYCVYLNVSDPEAVRNYRALQRAQRADLREAAAEQWNERDMARRQQRLLRGHDEAHLSARFSPSISRSYQPWR